MRLNSQLARGHYGLGIVLSGVGQVDEARLSMQRAIELDHNYSGAMDDLSLLELNAGRLDQSAVLGDARLAALPECAERVLPRLDCAGLLRR